MAHYELIVIGAGPGGYEAALHAAKLGKKVAVVEKREAGGTCLNRGCIPTKTLLHSSQIFHDAKHGAHAGIHTDDIRADMTEIFAYKREISQKLSSGIESLFKTAKIDFLHGAHHRTRRCPRDGRRGRCQRLHLRRYPHRHRLRPVPPADSRT